GFENKSVEELVKLLGHPHRQARMEAQNALTTRGEAGSNALAKVAREDRDPVVRAHAVRGLGMVARLDRNEQSRLRAQAALLNSGLAERAQDPERRRAAGA